MIEILSKRKQKYRSKIISTYHFNKLDQKNLDRFVCCNQLQKREFSLFKAGIEGFVSGVLSGRIMRYLGMKGTSFTEACLTIEQLGVAVKNSNGDFRKISEILNDISDKWNKICR